MKKFIFFARVYTCLIFALPGPGWAQNTNPYPNYVVIGAFEHQNNAVYWTDDANKNKFPARFEINPNRNLYYVYVLTTDDRKFAFAEALKLRTDTKYFDTWVYSGPLGLLGNQELAKSGTDGQDLNPETGTQIESVEPQNADKQTGQTDLLSNLQGNDPGEEGRIADNQLSSNGEELAASDKKSNRSQRKNAKKKNADAGVADGSINNNPENNNALNANAIENISGPTLAQNDATTGKNDLTGSRQSDPLGQDSRSDTERNSARQGQVTGSETSAGDPVVNADEGPNQLNPNSNTATQPDQNLTSDLTSQSAKKKKSNRKQAKKDETALATPGKPNDQGNLSDSLNASPKSEAQSNPNTNQDQNALTGLSIDPNSKTTNNNNSVNGLSMNGNSTIPLDNNTGTTNDDRIASNTIDPVTGKELTSTTGANQNQAGVKGQTAKGQENAAAKNSNAKTSTANKQGNKDTGVASNTIDPVTGKELTSTGANQNQAGVKGQTAKGQENAVAKNSNTQTATGNEQGKDTGVASNTIDPVTGKEQASTTGANQNQAGVKGQTAKGQENAVAKNSNTQTATGNEQGKDTGVASNTIDPVTGKEQTSTTGANQNQAGVKGQTAKGQENAVAKNSNTQTATGNKQGNKDTGVASNTIDPVTGKEQTSTTGANQNQAGVKGQTAKGQENAVAKNSNTQTATGNKQGNKDTGVASNTIDPVTGKEQTSTTGANQNQAGVKGQTAKGQENAVAKNSNTQTATGNEQGNKDTGVASNTIDPVTGKEQTSTTGANQNQAEVKGQTAKGQENAVAKNSNTQTATGNEQGKNTGVASNTIDPVTGKELTSTTGANQNQAGVKGQTAKGQENAAAKNSNTKTATGNEQGKDTGVASNTIDPVTGKEQTSTTGANQNQAGVKGQTAKGQENAVAKNSNTKTVAENEQGKDTGVASNTIDPVTGKEQTSTTGANQNQAGVKGQTAKGQENAAAKNSNTKTATGNEQGKDTGVASNTIDPVTGKEQTSTTGANQNQAGVKGQAAKGQENAVAKNSNTKTATGNEQGKDTGVASNTIDPAAGKEEKSDTTANNQTQLTVLPREVKHAPPPKRTTTEPLKAEEVAGKNFYFYLFRAETLEGVEGEVDAVDFEKARKMATYRANSPVKVLLPAGKSKQISFVCHVFGYRKLQKEYDPNNPSEDLYLDENGNLVMPFELMRMQRGDIAIMYNVFFFKDAAVMRPESRYEVNNLLELLNENPSYKIMIHGHTNGNAAGKIIRMDKPGNFYSLTNTSQGMGSAKKLSEERALLIREYLISSGVRAERMQVKAWGGKKPIHDKHAVRANENVRVEIEILSD